MGCSRCGAVYGTQVQKTIVLCIDCFNASHSVWERSKLKDFNRKENWGDSSVIDPWLLILLQEIRTIIGQPFHIHCAYEEDGHAPNSFHYFGQAVDFHVGVDPKDNLLSTWKQLNIWWPGGIGVYPHWNKPGFHLDIGTKRRWWRNRLGTYACSVSEEQERKK